MRDKRDVMRLHIQNGIRDLNSIRESYNSFGDGGFTQRTDAIQSYAPRDRFEPIPISQEQQFNLKHFGQFNRPEQRQQTIQQPSKIKESQESKRLAEERINTRERLQKFEEEQRIDKERELKVVPYAAMGLVGAATGTLPAMIAGEIGGKVVDYGSKKTTGKSWGENVLPEAPFIGELTNPGYIVGGLAGQYKNKIGNFIRNKFGNEQELINLYHGGLEPTDIIRDLNPLDISYTSRQSKRGGDYGGLYFYPEKHAESAFNYGGGEAHKISINKSAKIFDYPTATDRISFNELQKLKDEGFDFIRGNDIRGRQEYILLNPKIIQKEEFLNKYPPKELTHSKSPLTRLKGYKEIKNNNFKSEIDWGNWNKEIPENKALIQEYNSIEQAAKTKGTWMKNPDGSTFSGTPEQFVQQSSSNFKKAGLDKELLYHGTKNKFDEFTFDNFNTNSNSVSKKVPVTYLTNNKKVAEDFLFNEPGTILELYSKGNSKVINDIPNYTKSKLNIQAIKNEGLDKFIIENTLDVNPPAALKRVLDGIGNKDYKSNIHGIFNNQLIKSAIGNNGMFDMTNPNIYKGLVPAAGLYGLIKQQ